jgi:hypothetical protein
MQRIFFFKLGKSVVKIYTGNQKRYKISQEEICIVGCKFKSFIGDFSHNDTFKLSQLVKPKP